MYILFFYSSFVHRPFDDLQVGCDSLSLQVPKYNWLIFDYCVWLLRLSIWFSVFVLVLAALLFLAEVYVQIKGFFAFSHFRRVCVCVMGRERGGETIGPEIPWGK